MFIAVGSHSNVPPATDPDPDPLEFHRADILEANPDGSDLKVYAYGIRNGSGVAINPTTGELWTSVNERDEIGDNLPPDYITHVQEAASTAGRGITSAAIRTRASRASTPN